MRILSVLDNRFYLSGVNAYWHSMTQALEGFGHRVHTLVLDDGACPWNQRFFDALSGRTHRLQTTPFPSQESVERTFINVAPDLVIHHYSDIGLDASIRARSNGRGPDWRDVYLCHSDDTDHYNRIEKRKESLAHVICVSETCRNHVVRELGFHPENTSLAHYFFMPPPGIDDAVRRKTVAQGRSKRIKILYAGRLESYQKRAGDLGAFVESLRKRAVSFQLHVAGSGSLGPALRERLSPFVADGTVVFHGYLSPERLFSLMEEAAVYVSFSEFEGLSTSLVQAMYYGLIPLITPTKSGSDFLEHGKEALFFDVGDTDAAAGFVQWLSGALHRQRQMVGCVVEKIASECSPDNFSLQISSFMERIEAASP